MVVACLRLLMQGFCSSRQGTSSSLKSCCLATISHVKPVPMSQSEQVRAICSLLPSNLNFS